ncbi:MAG: HD domain-containing protein [Candidatus Nomurabacteria bacterium]|nr:HD domain-containing protein [Candidatus Nomurabacteria bacterium]
MSSKNKKDIEATYTFMKNVYLGNWEYRWKGTPHMRNMIKNKKRESILAHELACMGFWFNLKRICPNLSKLVDSEKIYEILWGHDLGEIFAGDVSQTLQIQGRGKNKQHTERQEIIKMAGKIPAKTLKTLLKNFDDFENYNETEDINVLVCKFIDNVQGNHFGVVFGNDHKINSDLINKILNRSFIKNARRLLEVLKNKGHKKAYKEVKSVAEYLIYLFKKSGTELKLDKTC